ncbi:hypothetical protein [Bradyrhizobium sp. HKCCYLS20291]|uniref:hypothetical protein n=1 Tax=Bradyrhizobium sp. HKCCYLS20291 TaxID=3420766 RepID=UPI003EB80DE3
MIRLQGDPGTCETNLARHLLGCAVAALLIQPALAAEPPSIGLAALEFGPAIGSALLTQYRDTRKIETAPDDFSRLAYKVEAKINEGRSSSGVVAAYFNFQTTALTYAAVTDPEPLSKGTAAAAAWGSKLAGDAITKSILDKAQDDARGILAQGLKNSHISDVQLRTMTADQLRARVKDLQIGGQKMSEIFQSDPRALQMLEAESLDLAVNLGVENLARSAAIGNDVAAIKGKVASLQSNLKAYQEEMGSRLQKVEAGLGALSRNAEIANVKLNALKDQVAGNTTAIRSLAAVSYSGWSTAQKIQAVESGLFPDIAGDARTKLVESLQAQQSIENTVASIQSTVSALGNLATIAGNIGVSNDVVNGLQAAQAVAGSVVKFATGDVLGSIAGLTSLVGLGAPDAAAQRHAETMKFLRESFAEVNRKLDTVIDLQIKTLNAIADLAKAQDQFRKEVTQQLDRIETTVLQNQEILQNIVIHRWSACNALFYDAPLNGQFEIPDRKALEELLKSVNLSTSVADCYGNFVTFLNATVKPANWSGDIIAAELFPTDQIVGDVAYQKAMKAYQAQKTRAFATARDFLLRVADPGKAQARILARLMQPVSDIETARKLDVAFARDDIRKRFEDYKCSDSDVLSDSLGELLCVGRLPQSPNPPVNGRFQAILNAPLIGPHAYWLMDMGISLSTIIDFAKRRNDGFFLFVEPDDLAKFTTNGPTPGMMEAIRQKKGAGLLARLRWLADAAFLQQSVTYGDYVAELAEQVLYDPGKRTITTDAADSETRARKQLALAAMKANPVLARNVVMRAMRHAIEDHNGGADKAATVSYQQTYFSLAQSDFVGATPCTPTAISSAKLTSLFPNFAFEYRVSKQQKSTPERKDCPQEIEEVVSDSESTPGLGTGLSVSIADFYVTVPAPSVLTRGVYEQSDGLRLASAYRDRVSQALIDRNFSAVLSSSLPADVTPARKEDLALQLLSKAWTWKVREKPL